MQHSALANFLFSADLHNVVSLDVMPVVVFVHTLQA